MADLALAPGQTSDGPPGAPGQAGGAPHMPPPPLPLLNTNPSQDPPAPGVSSGLMSPMSAGGTVRRAAPEPNKRALYVGGLDPRVTEDVLKQIFETTGHVQNVKIIPDKNVCLPLVASRASIQIAKIKLALPSLALLNMILTGICSQRASTMASSSTTILVRPRELCRP